MEQSLINKDNNKTNKDRHIKRWIYLSLAILINTFIIINSCLNADQSAFISNSIYNGIKYIINSISGDVSKTIPVSNISLSYNDDYEFNHIEGYNDNEIPVGISKSLIPSISPNDATNKGISYEVDNPSVGKLSINEGAIYISGVSTGNVKVKAISKDNNQLTATYDFVVVDLKEPVTFELSKTTLDIYKDALDYLPLTVNNNFYNASLLNSLSGDTDIVDINNDGLIVAKNIGSTYIDISNSKGVSKRLTVNVLDNSSVIYPIPGWSIKGDNTIHVGEEKQLSVNWVEGNIPSEQGLLWESSDSSLLGVDNNGLITAKRKTNNDIDTVTIKATSKLDNSQSVTYDVNIINYDVTSFELVIPYYGNHVTDGYMEKEKTDDFKIWIEFPPSTVDRRVNVSSSDDSVVTAVTIDGDYLLVSPLKEGTGTLTITSVANPSLKHTVTITVVPKGAINDNNSSTIKTIIRKVFGHGLLFLLSGLFLILFLLDVLKDKKWWIKYVIAIGIGLVISIFSELMQIFVPGRYGDAKDILIDMLGFIIPILIVFIIRFVKHRKNKSI